MTNLNTYGYKAEDVKAHLSEAAKKSFEQFYPAVDTDPQAWAFVQACFNLYMQMKSVASGDRFMLIADKAITETVDLLGQE